MTPTPAPPSADDPAERRRNYRLGVLNGALYQAGEGFIDSNTVVPVFLSRLTHSNALIGLAASFPDLGWFLPQSAVVPWLSRYPRAMWLYRRAAVIRAVALGLLAALIVPLESRPGALLATFLASYGTYCLGAGLAAVSFMEVVGKTVPHERLGAFWSMRLLTGGLLVAGAGLFVRTLLRSGASAPHFALLFALATVLVSIAYACFSVIREPDSHHEPERLGPLGLLREGLGMLRRDAHFRRLLIARSSLSVWYSASPFIVLFAVRDLGGGARAAGSFLMARMAGYVLSNLLWHSISQRHGNRGLVRIAAGASSLLPLVAAAIAVASPWGLGWLPAGAAVLALEVVTVLGGAAQSAMMVGYASLMLLLAPPGRRQAFVGLINTFLGPTMILPALGGAIVDWVNAPVLFGLCSLAGLIGVRAAWRLRDTRDLPPEAESADVDRPGGKG